MGLPCAPLYGEDLGSAIEDVEKIVAKIKTNKYDKKDIIVLKEALVEIDKYINENKD